MQPSVVSILCPWPVTTVSISLGNLHPLVLEILNFSYKMERCSLVSECCNLVQINFIKLNDCLILVVDGGINGASVRVFVI